MLGYKMSQIPGSALSFAVLFTLLFSGRCSHQVPLVMWSSEGHALPRHAPPLAGHTVSGPQLLSYLTAALSGAPHNVLLFLQDKLSMDDFTVFGGVFGNKQDSAFPNLESALQSSTFPLVLPALSWPDSSALPGMLQEQLGTAPLYLDPETLAQLRLNSSGVALLVFRLPYSTEADMMSPRAVLRGNDEVVGQVLNIMKAQGVPYTAVYTAVRPSRVIAEGSLDGESVGRSLLQASSNEPYPPVEFKRGESTCILLWAENLTVSHFREQWRRHELGPQTFGSSATVSLTGSSCNRTHSRLVLNYENVLGFRSFRLIFSMSQRYYSVSARNWFTMDQVELEYDGQRALFNGSRNIYAPTEYSYRCESVTSFRDALLAAHSLTDNATQWRLSFEEFQIQGFNVTGTQFSYASDCASFFTPGIWMGLVTSLLMLLVFTYGLHMIMQLRTMDRFDDPKGPAIAVPQNE
ncbi:V-type proton ATPase subunit S1-like [Scleropages formosus]|uniref:ATPase H+ transporting accessory protein 1a n=1 Tax=Scleropages formosus TaxID=113540 RepID=A0A0P7USZ3_SCLFO|nr:V-type proton ATPase subunit S1-like [Scleropages formosus]KPP72859.1 V-type proton ATPase subunit S1-like [Scleropages formosus]